jgi:hypothetical protein
MGREGDRVVIRGPGIEEPGHVFEGNHQSVTRLALSGGAVTRSHLAIDIDTHKATLTDQNSTVGSYFNGRRFENITLDFPGEYPIRLGDNFTFSLVLTTKA